MKDTKNILKDALWWQQDRSVSRRSLDATNVDLRTFHRLAFLEKKKGEVNKRAVMRGLKNWVESFDLPVT
jgi:hypothetical protein